MSRKLKSWNFDAQDVIVVIILALIGMVAGWFISKPL